METSPSSTLTPGAREPSSPARGASKSQPVLTRPRFRIRLAFDTLDAVKLALASDDLARRRTLQLRDRNTRVLPGEQAELAVRDHPGQMDERDLKLVAAEWEANQLARERVPELATALLEEGYDTPTLRVAAGLLPSELDEAHTLFGRALAELGYQRQRDGRRHGEALAREYARRGLDGRMPLVEAVGGVCNLSLRFEREDWSLDGMSMTSLLVLADEWEDQPKKRPAIEDDMRRELQRFSERRS